MVCGMLHRLAWIYNRGTPLRPYIHYYNRAAVLSCIASGVALVSGISVGRPGAVIRSGVAQAGIIAACVGLVYIRRLNGYNCRKRRCKALRAALRRGLYNSWMI